MIRLVIADDHPIVLYGLEGLFRAEKDFQVLASCTTGAETLNAVRQHQPNVLLLDLNMAETDPLALLAALRREPLPPYPVLIASAFDEQRVIGALRLGVRGMVLKSMPPKLIVKCVRKVAAGERWLETESHANALDTLIRATDAATNSKLSPREIELVRLVAQGFRNRDIATQLGISMSTVKVHIHNALRKLELDSRVELALYARSEKIA